MQFLYSDVQLLDGNVSRAKEYGLAVCQDHETGRSILQVDAARRRFAVPGNSYAATASTELTYRSVRFTASAYLRTHLSIASETVETFSRMFLISELLGKISSEAVVDRALFLNYSSVRAPAHCKFHDRP